MAEAENPKETGADPEKVPAAEPGINVPGEAEVTLHPLDLLDKEAEAELKALEEQLLHPAAEVPPETPPAGDPAEPAKVEGPADGLPAETPPAEEKPPEQKAAETPPAEEKKERPKRWKELREAKRAKKVAEEKAAQEAALRQQLEAELAAKQPKVDEFGNPIEEIKDPLSETNEKIENLQKQLAELNKQKEIEARVREMESLSKEVEREEQVFKTSKAPDYQDALNHLVDSRRNEYDRMGFLDQGAESWLVEHPEIVERQAREMGKDPSSDDDLYEAAREISFRILIDRERQALIQSCRTTGRSIPEVVYDLAKSRGYQTKAPAAPAAPAAPTQAEKAQDRVRAAMQAQAATKSLSAVQNNGAPRAREIKSREDIMALTEAEILELDSKQPGWDKNIFG